MYIKCWGSRGSIPVSGKKYNKYGGDTTCIEIRTKENDIIIVDAGTGIRRLGNRLIKEGLDSYHFILTHAHWDHLMGFPFFRPLFRRQTKIHMHRSPFHKKFMESMFSKVMAPPNFPVKYSDLKATIIYEEGRPEQFKIGSVTVEPIPISHPNTGKGYKFTEDGKSFVFITDNELGFVHKGGLSFNDYVDFSKGADLLIHDAEYTEEEYQTFIEWGHSTYTAALDLAVKAGVKKFGLFHLNQERSDDQVDEVVEKCKAKLKEKSIVMECFAVARDMVFDL